MPRSNSVVGRSMSDCWDDELVYSPVGETQMSPSAMAMCTPTPKITRKPEIDPINVGGIEIVQSSEEESVELEVKFDRS